MALYTESFFDKRKEGSYNSAKKIIPLILELAQPTSVIDVGCGTGTWLSVFKEYGIEDIFGVDGEWVEPQLLEIPEDKFLCKDLTKPLEFNRQFDLVVSLEVAEHLNRESADAFIDGLVKLGSLFLFSAAIPFQGGRGHVNEQWSEYWIKRFDDRGCVAIDCIRDKIWNDSRIKWWYSQNIFVFVKRDCLPNYPLLEVELQKRDSFSLMSNLVHPNNYVKKCKKWAKALKNKEKELGQTKLQLEQTKTELEKVKGQLEKFLLEKKNEVNISNNAEAMSQNFLHCITTRFGVGIYDLEWFRHRFLLFEAITLPSLMAQTDQRFLWLIRIDRQMPKQAREHLETITSKFSNILILEWDEVYESLSSIKYIRENLSRENLEYIITSRIDDDDAWRADTVQILHEVYHGHLPQLRKSMESADEGSFLNGLAITFPLGYEWAIAEKEIRESLHPWHSMSVSVISHKTSGINCFSTKHNQKQWMKYAENHNLKYVELNENTPMWLYLRHKQANTAHSKFIRSEEKPISVSEKMLTLLEKDFGICRDNYEKYLVSHQSFTGFNRDLIADSPSLWTERKTMQKQIRELTETLKNCQDSKQCEKLQTEIEALKKECVEKYTKLF